jgi:hypothetical protein
MLGTKSRAERRARLEGKSERSEGWDGPTFEYHALRLSTTPGATLESVCDQLGADGWEAVNVADGYLLFKRPMPA